MFFNFIFCSGCYDKCHKQNSINLELTNFKNFSFQRIIDDVQKLCKREDMHFTEVMTLYNDSYNEGYVTLGKPNVVRPVLYASDRIGGHCVTSNADILGNYFDSEAIDLIKKYK